jgi:thiamine pyrophosphate-dependent acetolactate synthase large subunit-like protein
VQVLHPREVDFNFEDAAIFEDMESGQSMILDPGMAREAYRQKYNAHNAALDAIFSAQGIPGFRVTTTEPLERVLRRFLEERPARAVVRQRRSNGRSAA